MAYIRVGVFELDDVLPYVRLVTLIKRLKKAGVPIATEKGYKFTQKEYAGYSISLTSSRYRLFALKGTTCVSCGAKGSFFALERPVRYDVYKKWIEMKAAGKEKEFLEWEKRNIKDCNQKAFHFNLYANAPKGGTVLMTKDHIVPRSKGGRDCMANYQPMCVKCNNKKGNTLPVKAKK